MQLLQQYLAVNRNTMNPTLVSTELGLPTSSNQQQKILPRQIKNIQTQHQFRPTEALNHALHVEMPSSCYPSNSFPSPQSLLSVDGSEAMQSSEESVLSFLDLQTGHFNVNIVIGVNVSYLHEINLP
jgi:hypothetical protein